jgi:mutual gliding-motility protein MglA
MSEFDPERSELRLSITYAGPMGSGKSASIQALAQAAAQHHRLITTPSPDDPSERMVMRLGRVFGRYTATACLRSISPFTGKIGAIDGIVFVADATPLRAQDNERALEALAIMLRREGRDLWKIPIVFQWNKRDLRGGVVEEVRRCSAGGAHDALCRGNPCLDTNAARGSGVQAAFQRLALPVMRRAGIEHALVPRKDFKTETRGMRRLLEAAKAMFS